MKKSTEMDKIGSLTDRPDLIGNHIGKVNECYYKDKLVREGVRGVVDATLGSKAREEYDFKAYMKQVEEIIRRNVKKELLTKLENNLNRIESRKRRHRKTCPKNQAGLRCIKCQYTLSLYEDVVRGIFDKGGEIK